MKIIVILITLLISVSTYARERLSPPLLATADIFDNELVLVNTETDAIIQIPVNSIRGWDASLAMIMHAFVMPNGKQIYLTTISTETAASKVVALRVKWINWEEGTARLRVISNIVVSDIAEPSNYPAVEQTTPEQPIDQWIQPAYTQYHGPALLPKTDYLYVSAMTGNQIQVINTREHQIADTGPYTKEGITNNSHGLSFNNSGTVALGTGYFYENNEIDVYGVNPNTGALNHNESILLGDSDGYAAITHYVYWINESQALVGTMQFAETSLTPVNTNIIGPSVWLVDTVNHSATMILGPTQDVNGNGVLRSISDLAVAGGKLYLAEEDSLDGSFGNDGFISIFDISNIHSPRLIKRLQPGSELPSDYAVSHGLNITPDNHYLYASSYVSGYLVKIDTHTDDVVKIFGPEVGLNNPHGSHISGSYR